jgi:delta 1-pyrroline-5-carboxylate dehydrogenase
VKPEPGSVSATKQVTIQLPRDFYEAAERRANSQGLDMQEVMARALEAFLGIRKRPRFAYQGPSGSEHLITKR